MISLLCRAAHRCDRCRFRSLRSGRDRGEMGDATWSSGAADEPGAEAYPRISKSATTLIS